MVDRGRKLERPVNELLPIAVSIDDNTLFCLTTEENDVKDRVLWFSGRLVDSFESFTEFFLAICDYNRSRCRTYE